MNYEALFQKLPGVAPPKKRQTFNEKLKWTLLVLLLYFILSETFLIGVEQSKLEYFKQLATLMGASMGTIITLGIGPIVTASIILQLLVGAKIINWDLSTHHGKVMFQGTQKILAFAFALVESIAYTLFGAIEPVTHTAGMILFIILQLTIGGWLIIFLDEIISKWGFGSGVSLFIAAGVSKQIFIQAFSIEMSAGQYIGHIPALLNSLISGSLEQGVISQHMIPIISTLIVFLVVVYAQAMRVEIPLAFGSIRGFGRKWPLKFIYTSNMPVILTAALLINVQVWSKLLYERGFSLLGTFSETGQPLSGAIYYLTPPSTFIWDIIYQTVTADEVLRVIVYTLFMVGGSVLFSIFWVNTAGMSAKNVAKQIQGVGMQIPGFRRDPRVIERVLERYIPSLAVLGGAFVGFLAAFADFTGALASGTGILLAVMIVYNLYEELATRHLEDMHPALRKFIEK